jgi:hypothetical protein
MVDGITDVNIYLTETVPVQGFLVVSGTHMSGCGSIKKVRHQLVGNTFIVSEHKYCDQDRGLEM